LYNNWILLLLSLTAVLPHSVRQFPHPEVVPVIAYEENKDDDDDDDDDDE
jgi:hypothetical protein